MFENQKIKNIIIGAGPAGLAAGYELTKNGQHALVLEKDDGIGGLCRTVEYKGYRFDLGGHRFWTKVGEVQKFWDEFLGEDFLTRNRLSRMYHKRKLFAYPVQMGDAFKKLGPWESILIGLSLIWSRVKRLIRKKPEVTHEDWGVNRFGKRLYDHFFQSYTEKLWGVSTKELGADWAAQRLKDISLIKVVKNFFIKIKQDEVKSWIEQFQYPKHGPGMFYQRVADKIRGAGGRVDLNKEIIKIIHQDKQVKKVVVKNKQGELETIEGDNFISSAPLNLLLKMLDPNPPEEILKLADKLRFRAFFDVGLIVNKKDIMPDNWIYTQAPEVKLLRVQNFKNWSPFMSADENKTPIGAEYVCWEGDELWNETNGNLTALADKELDQIGILESGLIEDSLVLKYTHAYPVYHLGYKEDLNKIFEYLSRFKNLQIIGRQGLFRYNNMDHSILTGFYAARNIMGEKYDILRVNADEEYIEMRKG